MAKRRPPRKDTSQAPAARFDSPFAELGSLRSQLPEGAVAAEEPVDPATGSAATIPDKVVVRLERKGRKGKTVTRVSGVGHDAAAWAQRLKRDLGCGGSVEAGDIILTGNLVDRTIAWLEAAGAGRVVRGS